jgi:GDP-L-fucose synthase
MEKDARIYVAGHNGLVGSALMRQLQEQGYWNLLIGSRRQGVDLRDSITAWKFFDDHRPDYVFLAAAKVGGIHANNVYPAEFIYDNLMIQSNVIENAKRIGVKKLMFLGSSCIYPKLCPQPIRESYLMTGPLEPTNSAYATAKIAGIRMCQAYAQQYGCEFISVMPTNLYGQNDNYDLQNSHVLPALIRKFHEAKERQDPFVTCWGTGVAYREFLLSDDMANACIYAMEHYHDVQEPLNIGTGVDVTISELAHQIKDVVGYKGDIHWDTSKPDGAPRKLLDTSKLNQLGWYPKYFLAEGLKVTYNSFLREFNYGSATSTPVR